MKTPGLRQRGSRWYLRRRVPARYAQIEPAAFFVRALNTSDRDVAVRRAREMWRAQLARWDQMMLGEDDGEVARYRRAQAICKGWGVRYMSADVLAGLPVRRLRERVQLIHAARESAEDVLALSGAWDAPEITISRAAALFWEMSRARMAGKSQEQRAIWRAHREKALRDFISVVGNIPISELQGDDMIAYTDWWIDRIARGDVSARTANKYIWMVANTLRSVNDRYRLGLTLPLDRLAIKEPIPRPRPTLTQDWIAGKILAPGALDGLNPDARLIVLAMINTGARPSEIIALEKKHIVLDGAVPHISITDDVRALKSRYSRRQVPLAGVSLGAFRAMPAGVERYDTTASASAAIHGYMRRHGLFPSDEHVLYCLRHAFEDRLLAADVDERIRRDLMGHRLTRERYGAGASLEQSWNAIKKIAL